MRWLLFFICLSTLISCSQLDGLKNKLLQVPPQAQYAERMRDAREEGDLKATAWLRQSEVSLLDSLQLLTPFQTTGLLRADRIEATGYRFQLREGELLEIAFTTDVDSLDLFVDLLRQKTLQDATYEHLLSLNRTENTGRYEVKTTGWYQLRVQPELDAVGLYELIVTKQPVLGFPVAGKDNDAIWSFWGDPRGGGSRKHEGIDIFADRGTPVVAITDGWITSVRNAGLGGKQVWLRDAERGLSLYYAHLDSQLVATGQRVRRNDTLGLVGNTGNAKNTRPHLHFGIYRGGAVDPLPYVYQHTRETIAFSGDTSLLTAPLARTTRRNVNLRQAPTKKASFLEKLPVNTAVYITGGNRDWYRVTVLPDNLKGYIYKSSLQVTEKVVRRVSTKTTAALLAAPLAGAVVLDSIIGSADLLAETEHYYLVKTEEERRGWVEKANFSRR